MPFGVVSAVGLGMGVLDFGGDRRRERAVYGGVVNLGRPIVGLTNGAFATRSSQITSRTCCYHKGLLLCTPAYGSNTLRDAPIVRPSVRLSVCPIP